MWAKLLKSVMNIIIILGIILILILGFITIKEGSAVGGFVVMVIGILFVLVSSSGIMLMLEAATNLQEMKTTLKKFCKMYEYLNDGENLSSLKEIQDTADLMENAFSDEAHTWKCGFCGHINHSGDFCGKCGRNKEK